jgi:hypothetical protein
MSEKIPARFILDAPTRARFGERAGRLGPRLFDGDPLADAAIAALWHLASPARNAVIDAVLRRGVDAVPDAPDALRELVRACERAPFWADFPRMNRGGAAFVRSGMLGGLVLGAYALTASYCSPAGNKPLTLSGRLEEETPRRLAETGRYVQLVSQPDALRPGQPGWIATVKVRLMHAAVRAMCLRSPRWNLDAWGTPINQPDTAGTGLLFSWIVLDGLDRLGFAIEGEEREALLHLWRYASWLLGVDDELLWSSEAEAKYFWELLSSTQGPPDEDSRTLVRALLESGVKGARTAEERARAERMVPVSYALSRYFLGDVVADQLGLPATPFARALPALRRLQSGVRILARALPGLPLGTVDAGARYWQTIVEQGLRGVPADFAMPDRLRAG